MTVGCGASGSLGTAATAWSMASGPGRPKAGLVHRGRAGAVSRWSRRAKTAQALAVRSKIVLACAQGLSNKQVAAQFQAER
jgi:predicted RNA polymerase sigma factor